MPGLEATLVLKNSFTFPEDNRWHITPGVAASDSSTCMRDSLRCEPTAVLFVRRGCDADYVPSPLPAT